MTNRDCKHCKYKKVCGGFRDKHGRCPENMVRVKDR